MTPVKAPVVPSPGKAATKADPEAESKANPGHRAVQTRVGILTRPDRYRRTVDEPRVAGWDVEDFTRWSQSESGVLTAAQE